MTTPPTPTRPNEIYAERLAARYDEQHRLTRRYSLLSGWRRLLLGVLVVLIILVEKEGLLTVLILGGVPALVSVYLIIRRARIAGSMRQSQWLASYYEQRLACLEDRWVQTGKPATRYIEPNHPAATDLDLFSVGGLFERLATPFTRAGEDTLAGWLRTPTSAAETRARQAAVAELRGRLDLREELALLAGLVASSPAFSHVARWGQAAPALPTVPERVLGATTLSLSAVGLIGGLLFATGPVPLLVALGLQIAFATAMRQKSRAVLDPMEERAYDLAALARLLARLERECFTSARMVQLQAELNSTLASRRVAWLHRLHRWIPFARVLASRPQMAILLDRWRQISGTAFGRWLAALGEIEALCALAAYSFECSDDPFPEILDSGTIFEAEGLGHPLFPRSGCVRNDLSLGAGGIHLLIISGSNMAGKSTLLRAVGVNVVLALAGGPVRAFKLRLAPLVVGANLRIQDSLLAGHSRFYAEILRLKQLLDVARGSPPLLFLLDELFQGTNSADRRIGAEAILRQLVKSNAIGLVTTHDLALTEIADQLSGEATNVHFEDRFENGELIFDYRMKPGVVRNTNALALMRSVGIEV